MGCIGMIGVSMVACTFSADTPNLVCGLVREGGVAVASAIFLFSVWGKLHTHESK